MTTRCETLRTVISKNITFDGSWKRCILMYHKQYRIAYKILKKDLEMVNSSPYYFFQFWVHFIDSQGKRSILIYQTNISYEILKWAPKNAHSESKMSSYDFSYFWLILMVVPENDLFWYIKPIFHMKFWNELQKMLTPSQKWARTIFPTSDSFYW